MKKKHIGALLLAMMAGSVQAQNTPLCQMEKLDRGVVAVANGSNVFVSWRFLGTDDEMNTTFDVLRNGEQVKKNLYVTNTSVTASGADLIQVVTKVNGEPVDTSKAVTPWGNVYRSMQLDRPAAGSDYTYSPNDCSVGDVDGDGEYELFVKWDPSNSKDNSQSGKTGNVYIDCYKMDGTKLWRVDLGVNTRAGAHYTQFLVYDFDGDGKAEMILKTSAGSKDGAGKYVSEAAEDATIKAVNNTKDWRNSSGKVTGGQEWLTVFEGATGKALHTIFYNPNRNMTTGGEDGWNVNWGGDSKTDKEYGNRGERYLATVAYLDGADKLPSAVMCRGYYTNAFLWAVDYKDGKLQTKWLHNSKSKTQYEVTDAEGNKKTYAGKLGTGKASGSRTAYGNGNHNLSCADVDGDGCDEIIWGACAIDHDGMLMYSTGYGHGDAIHLGNHIPGRKGLQVFSVHEDSPYGWDLHDAATGEVLLSSTGSADNGRGICGKFDNDLRESVFMSSNNRQPRSCDTGKEVSTASTSLNFRLYWDGDLSEELFDGGKIDKLSGNSVNRVYLAGKNLYDYGSSSTCNSTKQTPCLSADILGDWREEVILWDSSDPSKINIFTTLTETKYRMPTLMHDHTYRMAITWQNTAYNQPPHLGYYLPDAMLPSLQNEKELTVNVGDSIYYTGDVKYAKIVSLLNTTAPDGTKKTAGYVEGFSKDISSLTKVSFKGQPTQVGDYIFAYKYTGKGGEVVNDTVIVHSVNSTAIESVADAADDNWARIQGNSLMLQGNAKGMTTVQLYDMAGRTVMSRTVNAAQQHSITLPMKEGENYILRLKNGDKEMVRKTGIK